MPTKERCVEVEPVNANNADDNEEEVFIVEIEDVGNFYTNDENNGDIYKILENEEVGEKIGEFKDGEVILY